MSEKSATVGQTLLTVYQIRIQGHLSMEWSNWFDGMTIVLQENGDTVLTGPVTDQAALYGLLKRVRDLGLPLLALNRVGMVLSPACGTKKANTSDVIETKGKEKIK